MSGGIDQQATPRIVVWRAGEIATALLPCIGWPTRNAEVRLGWKILRSEIFPDADINIWPSIVAPPQHAPRRSIECCNPAANTEVTTIAANEDTVAGNYRGPKQRLPLVNLGYFNVPEYIARRGIQRNRVAVEGVQEQATGRQRDASGRDIPGRETPRSAIRATGVAPEHRRIGTRQVEGQDAVR